MIKCDKGIIQISGPSPIVMAELEMCISNVITLFIESDMSRSEAEEFIDFVMENAKKSSISECNEESNKKEDRLKKSADEAVERLIKFVFKED